MCMYNVNVEYKLKYTDTKRVLIYLPAMLVFFSSTNCIFYISNLVNLFIYLQYLFIYSFIRLLAYLLI